MWLNNVAASSILFIDFALFIASYGTFIHIRREKKKIVFGDNTTVRKADNRRVWDVEISKFFICWRKQNKASSYFY